MSRILFVVPTLGGGGAERVVAVLASGCAEKGTPCAIAVFAQVPDEYEIHPQVERFYIRKRKYKYNIFSYIGKMNELRRFIKEFQPDVIIPFLGSPTVYSYLALTSPEIKLVATVRNNPLYDPPGRIMRYLCRYVYERADGIIFQNEEQKSILDIGACDNALILPNPVKNVFVGSQEHVPTEKIEKFVSVGRLYPQKNQEMLIRAFASARRSNRALTLDIYGEGPLFGHLESLIEYLGEKQSIRLMGRSNCIQNELPKYDAFVMCSDYEGMPNSLIEAMAMGLPCISTACPTGPRTLLGENERGWLVTPRDASALTDAVLEVSSHPSRARERSLAAREYVLETCDPEEVCTRFVEYCERLVG